MCSTWWRCTHTHRKWCLQENYRSKSLRDLKGLPQFCEQNFFLGECLQRWKMSAKKTKSFGGKIVHRKKKVCGFELCLQLSKKYTSLLAGKLSIEKKKSAVLNCVFSWAKNIQVFWREKSCIVPFLFSYQTSRIYFVLTLEPVQIRRIFFPLGNPPYAKKSKREPTFWLVTRPFSQRQIFSLFWLILNSRH